MRERVSRPAVLMILGRGLNLGFGFLMIPLLIHYLKSDGFAAWALLLSCAAVLSVLDVGMPAAFVREASRELQSVEPKLGRQVSTALVANVVVYLLVAPAVFLLSPRIAGWLKLPSGGAISGTGLILLVFLGVALRSLLRLGFDLLYAARDFRLVAILASGQALVSNAAACMAAALSHDLAMVVAAFWAGQIAVSLVGACVAARRLPIRWGAPRIPGSCRRLLKFGLKVQAHEWAQTINFQFDKFVVLSHVGLRAVSIYEVANRSVLALRSLPATAMDTFLPGAVADADKPEALRAGYLDTMRLSASAVGLFILAPLAVAPVLLTAWVGEIGYAGRWTFSALAVGTAANLIAFPSGTLVQALDRPGAQARAAVVSMLLNVPLSLALVRVWGVDGAATGTAIAMVASAGILVWEGHRAVGLRCVDTFRQLAREALPLWGGALAFGLFVHEAVRPVVTAATSSGQFERLRAIVLAGALYLCCVLLMLGCQAAASALSARQRRESGGWRGAAMRALQALVPAH